MSYAMSEAYPSYFGFENLEVYQLTLDFVGEIYLLTQQFPKTEMFGLTNQIQRAATSIGLNISEGRGRDSDREFARFLNIARGSLFDVVSGLFIASRLGYVSQTEIQPHLASTSRIKGKINALVKALDKAS